MQRGSSTAGSDALARARAARGRSRRGLPWLVGGVVVAVAAAAVGGVLVFGGLSRSADSSSAYVGGDLHVLASIGDRMYVGGHGGAAVSRDGGKSWSQIATLQGADPMGWAETTQGEIVGGHPGLFASSDGSIFTARTGAQAIPDVHAIGAAGDTAYLASTQLGLLASDAGGAAWEVRNGRVGHSFMGTILVDPDNSQRLLAPDMASTVVASSDGGRTWSPLGGAEGPMSVAWDPGNRDRIVVVGMNGATTSSDGGKTWSPMEMPSGASAVTFSADGDVLYAATLNGQRATVSASRDSGKTWDHVPGGASS